MKAIITNISDDKFTLNGTEYRKTFMPVAVDGDLIRIVNVYDSKFQLLKATHTEDVEVDGQTYSDRNSLISALTDVLIAKTVSEADLNAALSALGEVDGKLDSLQDTTARFAFDTLQEAQDKWATFSQEEKDALEGREYVIEEGIYRWTDSQPVAGDFVRYLQKEWFFDTLAEAQLVDPKPADGTIFQVSEVTDPDNAGYYSFQSSETAGTRFERPSSATGKVEEGNTQAVSGGEVFTAYNDILSLGDKSLNFTLHPGSINNTTGGINTSVNWLRTGRITVESNTQYYMQGLGVDLHSLSSKRVACYNDSDFLGAITQDTLETHFTFTTIENTNNIIVQIEAKDDVATDIDNSPFWDDFKIVEGDEYVSSYIRAEKIKGELDLQQIVDIENNINENSVEIESINSVLDNTIEITYEGIDLNTTSGGITEVGNTISSDADYRRTSVSNSSHMITIQPNTTYVYTGTINGTNRVGIAYKDENFSTVGTQFLEGTYTREPLIIPDGAVYIGASSYLVDPIIEIINYGTNSNTGVSLVYIDANYQGETEDGTLSHPFKTFTSAIGSVKSSTSFFIKEGDYRETIPFAELPNGRFSFIVKRANSVRILGSEKLTGFAATEDTTNVYEVPYNGSIIDASRFGKIIYEDGNPSREVAPDERHPLQKSASYRLPFSYLTEKNSIEDVELNAGTFYYDEISEKIYIHPTDSSNPLESGYSYEIAVRSFNTILPVKTDRLVDLFLDGLQFYFGVNGLRFRGYNSVERRNITSMGVTGAGAICDDTTNVISYNDETAFCNGDGINGHFGGWSGYENLTDYRSMQPTAIYFEPWSHDNHDDGISHHENHNVSVYGGLIEYNGDGGIRASNDSGYIVDRIYSRKNGLDTGVGEGIAVVNPTSNQNRNGCKMVATGCFLEENAVGVSTLSSDDNVIEVINSILRNNTTELKASSGKIISRNNKVTNTSGTIKQIINGSIEVINDDILS